MQKIFEKLKELTKPCLQEDLQSFARWLEYKNLSKNTIKSYMNDIYQSLKFFSKIEAISLQNLIDLDINEYRALLASISEKSPKTQERLIATWKKWSAYKAKDGIETKFKQLTYPKQKQKTFANIELESIEKFLSLELKTWKDYRNKALITLLYSCGLRINEALNLKWDDIKSGQNNAKYVKILGKGSKYRYAPILEIAMTELEIYKKQIEKENPEFYWEQIENHIFASNNLKKQHACSVARDFRTISARHNLPNLNPHKFRHACATHLLKSGCDLRTIQTLLGHANLETTKIYIQHSTQELHDVHKSMIDKNKI